MDASPSYWHCFAQRALAEVLRQALRGYYVNMNTWQALGLNLDRCQRHKCGVRRRIDKQIQVAAFSVLASNCRTEDPRAQDAVAGHDLPKLFPVRVECL